MPKQVELFLPVGANNSGVTFVNADSTTRKTLFTAGSNDSDVIAIICATDDTSAVNVELSIKRSGTNYVMATVNVPIAAGMSSAGSVPSVDLLSSTPIPGLPVNSAGKRYIPLKTGDTLEVKPLVAVTAAKTLYVSAFGQDY